MKVSIIIPTYQCERFICEAIDSCLNQTVKPYEIIVVDDGSTDRTEEICKRYIDRIIYIKNDKNMGIAYTRNVGLKRATGDYICFLSSDDIYQPNYIEEMTNAAIKYPNYVIYSNYYIISENGEQISEFIAPSFDNHEDFCLACIIDAKKNNMFVNWSTTFFPANIIKSTPFFEGLKYGEDLCHLLELALVKKVRFYNVGKILVKYRVHSGMTTQQKIKEIEENNKITFRRINELLGREIF